MDVLIIQGSIPNYRVPVFNLLAKKVNLTVIYSDNKEPKGAEFKTLQIDEFKIRHKFHKKSIYKIAKKFDAVICMYDFSYLDFPMLAYLPHKYRLIYWGIGVSASYEERYDENQDYVAQTLKIIKHCDGLLFYCDYPREKYSRLGADRNKMFVANNTVYVKPIENKTYDRFVFIGTLYKQKKIDALLDNYLEAYKSDNSVLPLDIIGGGDEYSNIEQWIEKNNLKEKVFLAGPIFDDEILADYFSRAVLCISPDQAGLSVLKSMGYGVPFVTFSNAITGGERFNIDNGVNGVLFDDFGQIKDIILDASGNTDKYVEMGRKAKEYYYDCRKISDMAAGFLEAINYNAEANQ